jgi:hypothetical protein
MSQSDTTRLGPAQNVFDDWNFANGCLFLGSENSKRMENNGSMSTIVKQYVTDTSDRLSTLVEKVFKEEYPDEDCYSSKFFDYRNKKLAEYMNIFYAQIDYRLKTSKDKQYCAIYSETGLHCDFYQQVTADFHGSSYPRGKFLFSLLRNTYQSGKWIVDFVTHPDTQETLILFNSQHGKLDVYDLTGKIKFDQSSDDIFFKSIEWVNDKYFLLHAWMWQPWDVVYIYNLDEFLRNKELLPFHSDDYKYKYGQIWFDGDDFKNYPIVKDGKVIMGQKVIETFDQLKFFSQEDASDLE